ncbi:hypothetical protein EZZ75_06615 [Neisseria meningitidis]|nr:hypothetical protein [Neisseria meningitidis]MBW8007095.1 hypothetical protein [Neisseria meningitidis]TKV54128.1 hypothetical protein EHH59_05645 [Neisseria meningitidis]
MFQVWKNADYSGKRAALIFCFAEALRFPAARLQTASPVRPLDKACAWGDNGVLLFLKALQCLETCLSVGLPSASSRWRRLPFSPPIRPKTNSSI